LVHIHAEVWEGVKGGVKIVNSPDEIPFKPGNVEHEVEKLDLELNHDIQAPSVSADRSGFAFRAFSWAPFSGSVVEQKVVVHPDGTVEDRAATIVDAYGNYSVGCEFPLDFGPSPEVLAKLASRPEVRARRAVAEYLKVLVGSEFILHQDLVKDHRQELRVLAEALSRDPDAGVAAQAAAALAAITKGKDAK